MSMTSASHDSDATTDPEQTAGPRVALPHLLLLIGLLASGCDMPRYQGPQLQTPPDGFLRKADVGQDRRMFPDRPSIFFDAWIESKWGEFSGIYINGHSGTTTRQDVGEARASAIRNPIKHPWDVGEIETVTIDGRRGWAWMEMWFENGLREVRYHVAVPYDSITYTVDFTTFDPAYKSRPDSIRAIVSSFAVGRTEWNLPALVLSVVGGVLVLLVGWAKLHGTPYEDMGEMTLRQFSLEDAGGDGQDDPVQSQADPPKVDPTE